MPDRQSTSCLQIAHSAEVSSEELLPGTARAEAELVGRFHYTRLVRSRPRTLGTWRVTTTSLLTADRVARLLGGHVDQDSARDVAEIMTTSSTIVILLAGPSALDIGWQRTDGNTCDGATQDDRQSCICPADFAQRRAAAKQVKGTAVDLRLSFSSVSKTTKRLEYSISRARIGHSSNSSPRYKRPSAAGRRGVPS